MKSPQISPPRSPSRPRRKVIHPLTPDAFESLRASQVRWGNRLLRLLGAPVPGERLLDALADQLATVLGAPYDVFFHASRTYAGAKFNAPVDRAFSTSFALEPDPDMGVISIDMNLVQGCLEGLLEDEPAEVRSLLPVTPRDFGLMNFVLLELLNWLCARGLPPISIPASAPDMGVIARQLSQQAEIVELVYAVSTPSSAGLVRIYVPSAMVQSMEIFVTRGTHLNRQRRRLVHSRLAPLRTRLQVEAARVTLGAQDYRSLAPGDILLPERHGFELGQAAAEVTGYPPGGRDASPAGKTYLSGLAGAHFPCRIRPNAQVPWELEFGANLPVTPAKKSSAMPTQAIDISKITEEKMMPSEEIQKQREDAAQMAPILEQTEVDILIAVGQVTLSMSELAQLQSGYVLELERRIQDGVDLVVDGVRVGVGELVLVEQRLGVRVLSIDA